MIHTDTLSMSCHICGKQIATKRVEHDEVLKPSEAIRWHERVIAHIRKVHVKP